MTEEQVYQMYRLLALAKYEERYVIPTRTPPRGCRASKSRAAALSFDGGPGMYEWVRSARPAVDRCPSPWRRSTRFGSARPPKGMAANADRPSRVNLLNWDGRGVPSGMFPRGGR